MTRFERACESPVEMGIMVAFCIVAYLEQSEVQFFTDEAMKDFLKVTGEDITKWLMEEDK